MRRLTIALRLGVAAVSALALPFLAGCEDGPNQTYSPAPAGAGDLLNSGNPDAAVDPVRAQFDASYPGRSKQEICTADEKQKVWAKMLNAPIEPPRKYAQVDMANSDGWEGLTIEGAEKINCQAVSDGNGASHWGDNGEVEFFYDIGTHIVSQMELTLGYNGKMTFKGRKSDPNNKCYSYKDKANVVEDASCPNQNDEYKIGVGGVILKNNQPFLIHWDDQDQTDADITELYDAAIATFLPVEKSVPNCNTSGACLVLADGGDGTAIFGFRPLVVYFITKQFLPQPLPSTPTVIYNFFVKSLPYSNAPMTLKLDKDGPFAQQALGPNSMPCHIGLGTKFQDFVDNCVQVSGDAAEDKQNYAKLVGGRTHDFDNIFFNVVGVNTNFTRNFTDTYDFVKDDEVPQADDVSTEWIFDVRAKGVTANDLTNPAAPAVGKLDNHGTGTVFREYARSVQADLNQYVPVAQRHQVGDPACLHPATLPAACTTNAQCNAAAGANGAGKCVANACQLDTSSWRAAAGCTGFEGMLIPGPKVSGIPQIDKLTVGLIGPYGKSFLKPGDPKLWFCNDPGSYNFCNGTPASPGGPVWDESYQRVIQVMGKGDVFNLPLEARDRRYYFRLYTIALVKYMKAAGVQFNALTNPTLVVTDAQIQATKIDIDNLLFDINDTDQDDQVKYVDRDFVDATHEPTAFIYQSDVKVGNQRLTHWDRRLDRDEEAMYKALQVNKSLPLGKEDPVRLTNLFGSPILTANWESHACATTGPSAIVAHTGTKCPTGTTECGDAECRKDCCDNSRPPTAELDSKGRPLYTAYPGVWGKSVFAMGNSAITISSVVPNINGAKVEIPVFENPYDQNSPAAAPVEVLVPHLVKQPGVGFNIPLSGTRDKFITTGELDFSGNTSNYTIKYDFVVEPDPMDPLKNVTTTKIKIQGIDTKDFLGDVFLCQDSASGDILRARMYESSQTLLDWFNSHPGTIDSCDVIIRYSSFNNFIDKITARANGVTLDISKSQGGGRVDDALLWDPILATQ